MHQILQHLPFYLLFVLSGTVHECSHAWSAWRLGDPTARNEGRMSLNPLVHLDLVGTVIFPLLNVLSGGGVLIGWMRPVPVLPLNLRRPERDMLFVALAGPMANILLALLGMGVLFGYEALGREMPPGVMLWVAINLALAMFNLLPIPPLDGSAVVDFVRRDPDGRYHAQGVLGMVLLYLLLFLGGLDYIFIGAHIVMTTFYVFPWLWAVLLVGFGALFLLFPRATRIHERCIPKRSARRSTPLRKLYDRAREIGRRRARGEALTPEEEAWVDRLRADPGDGKALCSPVSFNGSNAFCADCGNRSRCAARLIDLLAEGRKTE